MSIIAIILVLAVIGGFYYSFVVSVGEDNLDGINLHLDDFYKGNQEMALAVLEEMKKQGRKCKITKLSNSFSEVEVDGKKYFVTARTGGIKGGVIQTIQLRPIKK